VVEAYPLVSKEEEKLERKEQSSNGRGWCSETQDEEATISVIEKIPKKVTMSTRNEHMSKAWKENLMEHVLNVEHMET
jgi:hypothetical protein